MFDEYSDKQKVLLDKENELSVLHLGTSNQLAEEQLTQTHVELSFFSFLFFLQT